jgi:hypothetical protein
MAKRISRAEAASLDVLLDAVRAGSPWTLDWQTEFGRINSIIPLLLEPENEFQVVGIRA